MVMVRILRGDERRQFANARVEANADILKFVIVQRPANFIGFVGKAAQRVLSVVVRDSCLLTIDVDSDSRQ